MFRELKNSLDETESVIDLDHLLRIAYWARDLEPHALERVQADIMERQYPAGFTICEYGDRFDYWAGVSDGLLKMRALSSEGKEVTLAGIHAGAWFGEGTILKNEARQYDIVALRPSTLALLHTDSFMWLFENSAAFARFLVVQMNERLGHFIAQVEIDRRLDTTARVARTLALMVNPVLYPGAGDYLDITQEELGQLAGVSRPTANQAVRQLQELGVLRTEYGGISILDLKKLNAFGEDRTP